MRRATPYALSLLAVGLAAGVLACSPIGGRGGPARTGTAQPAAARTDAARTAAPADPRTASGEGRRVPLADVADTLFWRILHAGQYDSVPRAMLLLKAAYLQNPRDPRITAHIGFLHAWTGTERARLASVPPTITDHVVLARTYFARAAALDPTDARVQGFHAVFEMSDAAMQRDAAGAAAALARGRAAITAWPEFNWFTVGYTLSGGDHASPLFREGLAMQWQTIDACSGTPIDRTNPTAAIVLRAQATEQDPRRRRACWNSWIAPHNVEGFFLNMGDMLVKSGDWRTGVRVYALAQGMDTYPRWAFRDVLEARIARAEQNVAAFRRPDADGPERADESQGPRIMLRSRFACVACHQQ